MVGYNVDHPDHPIKLGSVNGSNTDNELEGEETFNILAPKFQEDPSPKDEDDDEDDKGESESESDEGEVGGQTLVANDDESDSSDE